MLKTHYRPPAYWASSLCGKAAWRVGTRTTETPSEVTCKDCLRQIRRLGIRPRDQFPEVPTFDVTVADDVHVRFRCPICGVEHWHSHVPGHRVAHCLCWPRGYVLAEPVWPGHGLRNRAQAVEI